MLIDTPSLQSVWVCGETYGPYTVALCARLHQHTTRGHSTVRSRYAGLGQYAGLASMWGWTSAKPNLAYTAGQYMAKSDAWGQASVWLDLICRARLAHWIMPGR